MTRFLSSFPAARMPGMSARHIADLKIGVIPGAMNRLRIHDISVNPSLRQAQA
ncbi:hypothetical protein [Alcaligenes sp. Marseille-Q7550]